MRSYHQVVEVTLLKFHSRENNGMELPYQQQEEMNEAREKLKQRYDYNLKKDKDLATKKRSQGICWSYS